MKHPLQFIIIALLSVDIGYCKMSLESAVEFFSKAEDKLNPTDFVTGTLSDLLSVHSTTNKLRGEDNEANREAFNQALVTLTALDVGGGALVPITEGIIDGITRGQSFKATRMAWESYNSFYRTHMINNWNNLDPSDIKKILSKEKLKILLEFEQDAKKIEQSTKTYKALVTAKKWFKVKSVASVLGPLFDAVSIGVNSWSLHTALRDCYKPKGTCDYGAMYGATLSICSGVVGIFTFAGVMMGVGGTVLGPVGAVLGLTLGIAATLVERFWPKPVDYEAIEYSKKTQTIQQLERFSREQLYAANQYMHKQGVTKNDIYVVHQGHLSKIMNGKTKKLYFKVTTRQEMALPGQCKRPIIGEPSKPTLLYRERECPYLVAGEEWKTEKQDNLGYDFYGFTPETSTRYKKTLFSVSKNEPYTGSTILINTNQITKEKLEDGEVTSVLRGFDIDTTNGNANAKYNDLISLGQMSNLDVGEKITIKTGGGNDALNIDGMFGKLNAEFENVLDADLGVSGHNSLSFMGLQLEKAGIKGIKYNTKDGKLEYAHEKDMHTVGHIRNTELIVASSGNDLIKLFANKAGKNKFDLTVMKFAGTGAYEIDVQQFRGAPVKRFKVIDGTTNGAETDKCDNHKPEIAIINLPTDAVPNDILYKGSTIEIYANTNSKRSSVHISKVQHKRGVGFCSAAGVERNDKGGTGGKRKIATIFLSSRCPVNIRAEMTDRTCVLNRPLGELDLMFYNGRKIVSDFSQKITQATQGTDVVILQCPNNKVITEQIKFNLKGGKDTIVLRKDVFIDPCGIDGEETTLILKKGKAEGNRWKLQIKGGAGGRFQQEEHIIKDAVKVINEYGTTVFNFRGDKRREVDLFDLYTTKTALDMIGEKESEEVKKEMTKCMKEQSVIQKSEELVSLCRPEGV